MSTCLSSDFSDSDHRKFFIREKIREIERKMASIKSAKETFLKKISNTQKQIENLTQKFSMCIQSREKVLKCRLQVIGRERILEWTRQMQVCLNAEQKLQNFSDGAFGALDEIRDTYHVFAAGIGFIKSAAIKFDFDENVLNEIENFGELSTEKPPCCPKFTIGGKSQPSRLHQPLGVCSDATGRILVADFGKDRIQVFNEFGEFLFHFGESGSRPGEFHHPSGIAVDKKFRIIVSVKQNHRIQVFSYAGGFLIAFGQKGTSVGQFRSPRDVAVNEECEIAVSDTKNRRIQIFTPHGRFIRQVCFAPNLKISPGGVAFKPDGTVLVTDFSNNRLLKIGKEITFHSAFQGEGFKFSKPQAVACNRKGEFAVADVNEIKVFDENGNLFRLIDGFGGLNPRGVSFLHDDSIAVAVKDTVRVF